MLRDTRDKHTFVEFCDEKNFTNGKKCNIIFLELNLIQARFVQNFFEKIKFSTQKNNKENKIGDDKNIKKYIYTNTFINAFTFIISISIFFITNFCYSNLDFLSQKASLKAGFTVNQNNIEASDIQTSNEISSNVQNQENIDNYIGQTRDRSENWYIEIPSISLKAEIQEGTTKEIMDKYVGHFEETQSWVGNIGLAAHNRGYKNNYFADIKKLKEGDIINYCYNNNIRKYVVTKQVIIEDTDWTYLEDTEENTLTLITCVENEPKYRRCVQATEDKQ